MKKLLFGSVIAFLSLIILINVSWQSLKKDVQVGNWNPSSKEKTGTNDLEKLLYELPDVIFKKLEPSPSFERTYLIKIKQPIDHDDVSKGFFYQKVFLTHKGFDRPTVIVTEGYAMWENSDYELTELLNANQIKVEHRYYGESMPDSVEYRYLSFEQAAADYHYVQQLFSRIYKGKWISTGHSKGGVGAIIYRYFYPDDIDVCVPLAAPIILSNSDQRFIAFLDTIFGADCSDKIRSFQIRLLENRESILPLIELYALGAKLKFTYLSLEQAFEYAVLEYPSCLLEYSSCEEIPDDDESIPNIVKHFLTVLKFEWFGDEFRNNFSSFFYQAATEMGCYAYNTNGLENLLVVAAQPISFIAPHRTSIKYDGRLMNDVIEWLNAKGDKFIYVYGAMDYWSAGAVPQNKDVDSEWFFLKDKRHLETLETNVSEMTDSERKKMISILENWLSLEIEDIFHNKE